MKNTKSGAGEEFLLLFCWAEACVKGMFLSQTPVGAERMEARGSRGAERRGAERAASDSPV